MRKLFPITIFLILVLSFTGCLTPVDSSNSETAITAPTTVIETIPTTTTATETIVSPTPTPTPAPTPTAKPTDKPTTTPKAPSPTPLSTTTTTTAVELVMPFSDQLAGYVVVIDPGHQQKADYELDPLAPGSTEMRPKVKAGTSGVATGRPEYEVNLEIAVLLRTWLESQGCTVYMIRTTNDVNISNIERAEFARNHQPDVYMRLHCDGSTDATRNGVGVFVADTGIYKDQLPVWGQQLRDCVCQATGARAGRVNASSNYPGLNWANDMPTFLLEMGFMTNPVEDRRLSDPAYQTKICKGITDFIALMPILPDA